jgi:hypothetical protein
MSAALLRKKPLIAALAYGMVRVPPRASPAPRRLSSPTSPPQTTDPCALLSFSLQAASSLAVRCLTNIPQEMKFEDLEGGAASALSRLHEFTATLYL